MPVPQERLRTGLHGSIASWRLLGAASFLLEPPSWKAKALPATGQVSSHQSSARFELRIRTVGHHVTREYEFAHAGALHFALQAARYLLDREACARLLVARQSSGRIGNSLRQIAVPL